MLTFSVSTDNDGLFSTLPTVDGSGNLTYTPAADANGSATVTVSLSDDGGVDNGGDDTSDDQTFAINVTPVNDVPSFAKGPDQTVLEDAGPQSVAGWATAISAGPANESGQALSFNVTANTNPALFAVAPAVDGSTGDLTYTPADDANGSATIEVTLSDDGGTADGGVDTSPVQTFAINVTAVNDVPSFAAGDEQTVLEDAGPQSVTGWATAISAGPADEAGQALTFSVSTDNDGLFSTLPAIDASGGLTYTPAADANGSATVTVSLSDDGGVDNGGDDTSDDQQFEIAVTPVNDVPSFVAGADETVLEDAGTQSVTGWATGISSGPANESAQGLTFNVTGNTNAGLFSAGPSVSPSGELTYTPADDANGSATITVELQDDGGTDNGGVDTSPAQTFAINVTAVNDVPSFAAGGDETVLEDAGPQSVSGWATAISSGPADEAGQALTFSVSTDNDGLFSSLPAVDASGELTYTPAADANGSATVTVSLSDDGGVDNGGDDTSDDQMFAINVTAVNDVPSFAKGPDQNVLEDAGPQSVAGWATGISSGPADESAQTLTFNVTGNTNPALFSIGLAIDASTGDLTYTAGDDATGSATIEVTLSDDGGTADGGVDTSAPQTFTIAVTPVNDAPTIDLIGDVAVSQDDVPRVIFVTGIGPGGGSDEEVQTVEGSVRTDRPDLFQTLELDPQVFLPGSAGNGELTYTASNDACGIATVTVTVEDNGGTQNGGVDTDDTFFTIEVLDTLPPVVEAALQPVRISNDQNGDGNGNNGKSKKSQDKNGDGNGNNGNGGRPGFLVDVEVTDNCDDDPDVAAWITQPLDLSGGYSEGDKKHKNKIEIKIVEEEGVLKVTYWGPDQTTWSALSSLLYASEASGGFSVGIGDVLRLDDTTSEDGDTECIYAFTPDGGGDLKLESASGPGIKLVVEAEDEAGNTTTVEVGVPSEAVAKPALTKPTLGEESGDAVLVFGSGNYPNPFNPQTIIRYSLPEDSEVRLVIYNVVGQQVRELVNAHQSLGVYAVRWKGRDDSGRDVASGVYLYRLVAGEHVAVKKMLFAK